MYECDFLQECLLGRAEGCDIRIQLPIVSKEHAKLKVQVTDGAVSEKRFALFHILIINGKFPLGQYYCVE